MMDFQDWIKKHQEAGFIVETFKAYSEFTARRDTIELYAKNVGIYSDRGQSHYAIAYPEPVCPHRMVNQMNEELIEKCRKEYYELNDFKHLSPMAKGGCKDLFYENIEPIIQFAIPLISAEARKQEGERMWNLLESYRSGDSEKGLLYTIPHHDWVAFRQALKEGGKEAE